MYKRVLVAVDGSQTSAAALSEALALVRDRAGDLRIVHVIDSPYTYPEVWYGQVQTDLEALRRAWRKAGETVLDEALALARAGGVPAESAVLESGGQRVAALVAEEAKRWGADLVVMGTHGRRGIEHLLLGSVAEGVARTAPTSVLLVRGR